MDESDLSKMTYEQAFGELEAVVGALETNQHPMEEAMDLFERGQALARHCIALLDQAELKIRTLSGEEIAPEEEADES